MDGPALVISWQYDILLATVRSPLRRCHTASFDGTRLDEFSTVSSHILEHEPSEFRPRTNSLCSCSKCWQLSMAWRKLQDIINILR